MLYCSRGSGKSLKLLLVWEEIRMKFLSETMKKGNHFGGVAFRILKRTSVKLIYIIVIVFIVCSVPFIDCVVLFDRGMLFVL